jgi:hypothetical protein
MVCGVAPRIGHPAPRSDGTGFEEDLDTVRAPISKDYHRAYVPTEQGREGLLIREIGDRAVAEEDRTLQAVLVGMLWKAAR